MPTLTHSFAAATSALAADGWCVLPGLLTITQTAALAGECQAMQDVHRLNPAGTGGNREITALRGDLTQWFVPDAPTAAQAVFINRMEGLRLALNRDLFLGLIDSESHYALYPVGTGYARHRDQLRHSDARVLSAVFYLNETWLDSEGGALRLYLADQSYRDVYPRAGTLMLFLSAQFEHEVLPASRQRMSIACWMRQRALAPN